LKNKSNKKALIKGAFLYAIRRSAYKRLAVSNSKAFFLFF